MMYYQGYIDALAFSDTDLEPLIKQVESLELFKELLVRPENRIFSWMIYGGRFELSAYSSMVFDTVDFMLFYHTTGGQYESKLTRSVDIQTFLHEVRTTKMFIIFPFEEWAYTPIDLDNTPLTLDAEPITLCWFKDLETQLDSKRKSLQKSLGNLLQEISSKP